MTATTDRDRGFGRADAVDAAAAAGGSLAVACLDLDFFKQVNDRFGHPTGDQPLIRFAAHVQSCVGMDGTVARMGGEEFMIVWPAFESTAATQSSNVSSMRLLRLAGWALPRTGRRPYRSGWPPVRSRGSPLVS